MQRSGAEDCWRLAKADPVRGLEAARRMGHEVDATASDTPLLRAAEGRALYELGRNAEALPLLCDAFEAARGADRGRIGVSYAAALQAGGDRPVAVDLLETLSDDPDPEVRALARSQLGLLRLHDGAVAEALRLLEASIPDLLACERELDAAARTLGNAGYCELLLGRIDRARDHLERAVEAAQATEQHTVVAGCLQNLGYAHMRLGDLPAALDRLEAARARYRQLGDPARNLSTLLDDLAETYRLAGLHRDAVAHAEAALRLVEGGGNREKVADARHRLALCLLDAGDGERAAEEAERASAAFAAAGRHTLAQQVRLLGLDALEPGDLPDPEALDAAEAAIVGLEADGAPTVALAARNRLLQAAVERSDTELARRFATVGVGAVEADGTGAGGVDDVVDQSIGGRLERALQLALCRAAAGGACHEQLATASAMLRAHRQRLGDPELRAGAARLAARFRRLAVLDAVRSGDAAALFEAEETWRSSALDLPRTRPARQPAIAALARAVRDASYAAAAAPRDTELAEQVHRLEEELRRECHRLGCEDGTVGATGAAGASGATPEIPEIPEMTGPVLAALQARLGGRRFVQWSVLGEEVHAVVVSADDVLRQRVGNLGEIGRLAAQVRRELRRILRPGLAPRSLATRDEALHADCARLGEALLGGLLAGVLRAERPGDPADRARAGRGLVLSPPATLAELPWPAILGTDEPIAVTPSARVWLGSGAHGVHGEVGALIGPGLEAAPAELDELRTRLTVVTVAGAQATSAALGALADRCAVLHVAAHGTFRADSPRFSSLLLADGPFALHDLDAIDDLPGLVVLAACDAGRSAAFAPGELLGAATAWLAAGTRTVVAPMCAVPDDAAAEVVGALYRALDGASADEAVAAAVASAATVEQYWTAASFLVLGESVPVVFSTGCRPLSG